MLLALRQAKIEALAIAIENNERLIEVAAMPTLANPLNWLVVVETERAAYRFNLSLTSRPVRSRKCGPL